MYQPTSLPTNGPFTPRIIIHGGSGNLTKTTVPPALYNAYLTSISHILNQSNTLLSTPGITALDVATHAVTLLENDPLYNSGHGAVFTRSGRNELECSIMVSNGYRKRGVGCMLLKHVKNPIKLARELLIRGEKEDIGGAQGHQQLCGKYLEGLAEKWGLEMCEEKYYFTQKRWDEHVRGLAEEEKMEVGSQEVSDWEKENYIPMGTCGAVVMDSFGTICVATSTGGITNKAPGRLGDTPTIGAGFWAEEWFEEARREMLYQRQTEVASPLDKLSRGDLRGLVGDCLPTIAAQQSPTPTHSSSHKIEKPTKVRHAVAISGTGNGDSFLRVCAARTTAAHSRFSYTSLSNSMTWMAGSSGELQKSAGEHWGKTGEGAGGMIGIEVVGNKADVVWDFNCGGLVRAWKEKDGSTKCLIFKSEDWEGGPEGWEDVYGCK
jgi:L-asparaginase